MTLSWTFTLVSRPFGLPLASYLRIAQAERPLVHGVEPGGNLARLVAVVPREALAAVVDRPGAAGERDEAILDDLQRAQARFLASLFFSASSIIQSSDT